MGTLLAQLARSPHGDIAWRCPQVAEGRWCLPDCRCLTAALLGSSTGHKCEELSGERCSLSLIASPSCTSDFQVTLCVELGVPSSRLRNRQPVSAPSPHSLCIWVSVRIEATLSNRNIQTCLQAADWKAAFLYLLGFSFSFHELTAKSHSKA